MFQFTLNLFALNKNQTNFFAYNSLFYWRHPHKCLYLALYHVEDCVVAEKGPGAQQQEVVRVLDHKTFFHKNIVFTMTTAM